MADEFNHIERIARLIIKYQQERLSRSELKELMEWRDLSAHNQQFFEKLSDSAFVKDEIKKFPDLKVLREQGWDKVRAIIEEEPPVYPISAKRTHRIHYIIAASVAALLVIGLWLYTKNSPGAKSDIPPALASNFKNDVAPGGNKAILTLSDGSHVVLDSVIKGAIARQGASQIMKLDEGHLAYDKNSRSNDTAADVVYNTLTTPAAGQFQITLPDGSKVWLNNASSLRYPVAFTGKEREVELNGEAYFEIAPNAHQPFKVKVDKTTVDVLGTSFNITAYTDESNIKTTLLSGSVRVSGQNTGKILKPGEQARINETGRLDILKDVDEDGVIAWKNGWFHFERADLRTVMRMLSRWYNVDVAYEGAVPNREFGGDIERKLNLSQVLEILQKNQVNFSLEGRRITVRP